MANISELNENIVARTSIPTGYISERSNQFKLPSAETSSPDTLPFTKVLCALLSVAEFGGLIYLPFHLQNSTPSPTEALIGLGLAAGLVITSGSYLYLSAL